MRTLIINILLIAVTFPAMSQSDMKYIRKGNRDYKEGQYKDAEINYLKALEENPSSDKAGFNLGNSLYRQENYRSAAEKYGKLADEANEDYDAAKYFYNLGNSFFKQKNYEGSVDAYRKSLLKNPDDMDARHNLQMALRMLKQQEQEQEQEQEQQQEQQQEQEQEQEQQQQQEQEQEQEQQGQNNEDKINADEDGNSQVPQQEGRISREDAERILQSLENEERDVIKRVQEQKSKRQEIPVGKNW